MAMLQVGIVGPAPKSNSVYEGGGEPGCISGVQGPGMLCVAPDAGAMGYAGGSGNITFDNGVGGGFARSSGCRRRRGLYTKAKAAITLIASILHRTNILFWQVLIHIAAHDAGKDVSFRQAVRNLSFYRGFVNAPQLLLQFFLIAFGKKSLYALRKTFLRYFCLAALSWVLMLSNCFPFFFFIVRRPARAAVLLP